VESDSGDDVPSLTIVESVRCLDCGAVYAKPSAGGTVRENPGCPECGYVGWVAADDEGALSEASSRRHFAADRLQHPRG
jgi:predicted  nucleic acid-binding Zn-ribbon protein